MSVSVLLFSSFALLLLIGAPITVALGAAAAMALYMMDQDLGTLVQMAFSSVNVFPLMALPAFMLAGTLMDKAGVSRRLMHIAESIVGPVPGGLAVSTALACVIFGAISGSGPATTAAVGMLMIPTMINRGYDRGYAAAAAATAGGVGIVIPPSIPMITYAVAGQQSIPRLFLAGVVPGLLIALGLSVTHLILCRKMKIPSEGDWSGMGFLTACRQGIWALMAPVVLLGGIYGGLFTPTESAVVAIMYTVFIGVFIHRELSFEAFLEALRATSWMTGRVLIIVFTAYAFGRVLVQYHIPDEIVQYVLGMTDNLYLIWFAVVFLLVLFGTFMETLAIILLTTPVLLPAMTAFGVDPILFGVVLICCCGVGFSTPPLGENLFIASGIADTSIENIALKAVPFCCVTVCVILLIIVFPELALWLPDLLL